MAKNGRYVFRNCVPDGTVDIVNVSPGEIITRPYSFRVNAPPDLQSLLDGGTFDPRNILTGKDGLLYDGEGNLLAEVNTFQAQVSFSNTDYQPAGSKLVMAIPVSYTVTLTLTETVISDSRLLAKVLAGVKAGEPDASLNFQGVLNAH